MSFRLREHTADIAVEATAPDRSGVFAAVADGLAAAHCDDIPAGGRRFTFSVEAEGPEALLFDYLDELIYLRDVRGVLPVDNEARVEVIGDGSGDDGERSGNGEGTKDVDERSNGETGDRWRVEASARGVPLADVDAREIKAVTYSQMRLEATDDGWVAYVVLDV